MTMTRRWLRALCIPLSAIVGASAGRGPAQASTAVLHDAPELLVTEPFEDWAIGAGLLSWWRGCHGSAEFPVDGYLRRRPLHGDTVTTLLDHSRAAGNCEPTFDRAALAASDDDGLHFVDEASGAIWRVAPGAPYAPTLLRAPDAGEWLPRSPLAPDGDWLYWVDAGGQTGKAEGAVRRASELTGESQVLASGLKHPDGLAVGGGFVFYSADKGVYRAPVTCAAAPCGGAEGIAFNPDSGWGPFHLTVAGEALYFVVQGNPQVASYRHKIFRTADATAADPGSQTLLHQAEMGWSIDALAVGGGFLYWRENRRDQPLAQDGALLRMPVGGGEAVEVAQGLRPAGNQPERIYADATHIYFLTGQGIARLPHDAAPLDRQMAAQGMEVNQSIQSLANDVRLAHRKATVVRVYAKALTGRAPAAAEAWLEGSQNGQVLPGSPLRPVNGARALGTQDELPKDAAAGWLFELPESWTLDGNGAPVELKAVLDPRLQVPDSNRADNVVARPVRFQATGPVCPILYRANVAAVPLANLGGSAMGVALGNVLKTWPAARIVPVPSDHVIEELEACYAAGFVPYPCHGPYEMDDNKGKLLASLWEIDQFSDDPDECEAAGGSIHYVAAIHQSHAGGLNGSGAMGGDQLLFKLPVLATDTPDHLQQRALTLAHEMGHNAGRQHVDCGGPEDPNPNYPYPPCDLDKAGPDPQLHHPFDQASRTPLDPRQTSDLMSYGQVRWSSDYAYDGLFTVLAEDASPSALRRPAEPSAEDADAVKALITGVLTPTMGTGELGYGWSVPAGSLSAGTLAKWRAAERQALPAGAEGARPAQAGERYTLALVGEGGRTVAAFPVDPIPVSEGPAAPFGLSFALPAAPVTELVLQRGAAPVARRAVGPSAPQVEVRRPGPGARVTDRLDVAWTGEDPDSGDHLVYTVLYSPDRGRSWRTVATGRSGQRGGGAETLTIDPVTALPGSRGANALVRVLATDGLHTTVADSALFELADRAPRPLVFAPQEGARVPAGAPLTLQGTLADAEDGGALLARLAWSVDDQPVGLGPDARVPGLASGEHVLRLTAFDTAGQSASVEQPFTVLPLRPPAVPAPELDGDCDDPAYRDAARVVPRPGEGGPQATVLLIRTGDGQHGALHACFMGLPRGAAGAPGEVALMVDADHGRGFTMAADDRALVAGEDGARHELAGDPRGWQPTVIPGAAARVRADASGWQAELRLPAAAIGGWGHLVGLAVLHRPAGLADDGHGWPHAAEWLRPDSWSDADLGGPGGRASGAAYLPLVARGRVGQLDGRPTAPASATPTAAGRVTASATPTPARGITASATPTPADRPSRTPTPTATETASPTRPVRPSRTPTDTPTAIATLTATPSPTPVCVSFRNLDDPRRIPDDNTWLASTLEIFTTEGITIQDVNVSAFSIAHGNDEDLDVTLRAPGGMEIELFTDVGGTGDNFDQTYLDSQAATSVVDGTAPFRGAYRPEGSLDLLSGQPGTGVWTLFVRDDTPTNAGRLERWGITFCWQGGAGTATATATPTAASRRTSTPTPVVRRSEPWVVPVARRKNMEAPGRHGAD